MNCAEARLTLMSVADQIVIDQLDPQLRAVVDRYAASEPARLVEEAVMRNHELRRRLDSLSAERLAWKLYAEHRDTCAGCFHHGDFDFDGRRRDTLTLCGDGQRLRDAASAGAPSSERTRP